jgi:hypothetical protein
MKHRSVLLLALLTAIAPLGLHSQTDGVAN